jgi:Putative ATP-binding cassette
MLRLLIGLRLRLAWNRIAHGPRRWLRVLGAVVASAFGLAFMAVVGLNTAVLIDRLARTDQAAPPALLPAILMAAATLSLVTSLSMAFHHLFLSADEELLLAAPVRLRDLFALKLFETWRDSIHILLFAGAALFGYGVALHQPVAFFVAAIAVAIVLTFGATVVGASLTLLVARVRYGDSLLGVSRLLSIALFLPAGALGIPAISVARNRGFPGIGQDGLQTVAATLRGLGPPPEWAPTTWAVHVLRADDRAFVSGVLLIVSATALALASRVAFERSFGVGWERVRFAGPRGAAQPARTPRLAWRTPRLAWLGARMSTSSAVLDMLRKDLRVLVRDPRWRTSLLVSLAALGIPVLLFSAGTDAGSRLSAEARFWLGLFPVPYLAYIAGSQHGAASLAYEGRNLALLRAAPVGFARLLVAKLAGSLVLVLAITWLATLVLAMRHQASLPQLVVALGLAAWLALGGTTSGLVGAALSADFETDNPQRRVGCLGTLLTSGLAALFFATQTALIAWFLVRTLGGIPRPLLGLAAVVDWLLPFAALCALVALVLAAYLGARRLASWEAS